MDYPYMGYMSHISFLQYLSLDGKVSSFYVAKKNNVQSFLLSTSDFKAEAFENIIFCT